MHENLLSQLTDQEVLTLTLFGEARGEPIAGLVAVGCVIRNRLHNSNKYKSYKDVCFAPKQFSCWNESDTNYPILIELAQNMIIGMVGKDPAYRRCLLVASGIIDWSLNDETKSSSYYITTDLFNSNDRPIWAKNPIHPIELGHHTFFDV